MDDVNKLFRAYPAEKKRSKRDEIRKKINSCMDQVVSLADNKIALALQTYETVDKNIKYMSILSSNSSTKTKLGENEIITPLGYSMPVAEDEPRFCLCQQVSYGDMVACENSECHIEWFHYGCVGLKKAPKGKWYCPNCRPRR